MGFQASGIVNTQAFGNSSIPTAFPFQATRNPQTTDLQYPIGKEWINTEINKTWQLCSFYWANGVLNAFWVPTGSGSTILSTLSADNGFVVYPVNDNIHIAGGTGVGTVGTTGTITINLDGDVATTYTATDSTTATPSNNNLNLFGTGSITSTASGSTVTYELTGLTNHAVLVGAGTATITKVGPTSTAGQVLQSSGSSADPAFSTATYPSTTTINQLLYSSTTNVVSGLTTLDNGVLITSASGVPEWLANSSTAGYILTANSGAPPSWQAAPASFSVQQVRSVNKTPSNTTTAIIASSNSVPTSSQGEQVLSVSITPTNSSHILVIQWGVFMQYANEDVVAALFQDSTTNALATAVQGCLGGAGAWCTGSYYMTAGTTSSTTFKVNVGTASTSGNTLYINSESDFSTLFGSTINSYIYVTEYTS